MRPKLASAAAIAVVAISSTSLAACGSSSSSPTKTAKYTPLTQANFTASMVDAVKNKHSVREVTTSDGVTRTIEFDNSGGATVLRITEPVPAGKTWTAGTLEMIVIGNDLYAHKTPGKTGDKWRKYPTSAVDLSKLTSGQGKIDAGSMVSGLTKGVTGFKYVGPSTIDGAKVQQYRVTITAAATGQNLGSADLGANSPVTESIYLNQDNTLRRVVVETPLGNTTVDFTKWGEPLGITAPPASQVLTK